MIEAGAGAMRLLRAFVFVTACATLTAGAHALGGGEVSLPALAVLAVACWPVALLSSARRLTAPVLFLGLGVAQVVGHLFMSALGNAVPAAVTTVTGCLSTSPHLGHSHAATAMCAPAGGSLAGTAGMSAMPSMPGMAGLSVSMVLSHVVAVAVLAYLLGRGEAVLWRVLDAVLPRLLTPVRFARPRPGLVVTISTRLHRHLLLVVARRGPPGAAL